MKYDQGFIGLEVVITDVMAEETWLGTRKLKFFGKNGLIVSSSKNTNSFLVDVNGLGAYWFYAQSLSPRNEEDIFRRKKVYDKI